jgi:hypothetical protein
MEQISYLDEFEKFVMEDCKTSGPDAGFEILLVQPNGKTYYMREVGPWSGYCYVDDAQSTIEWAMAIHSSEFKGLSLEVFLRVMADRAR